MLFDYFLCTVSDFKNIVSAKSKESADSVTANSQEFAGSVFVNSKEFSGSVSANSHVLFLMHY